jgi:hypothetical protein
MEAYLSDNVVTLYTDQNDTTITNQDPKRIFDGIGGFINALKMRI